MQCCKEFGITPKDKSESDNSQVLQFPSSPCQEFQECFFSKTDLGVGEVEIPRLKKAWTLVPKAWCL